MRKIFTFCIILLVAFAAKSQTLVVSTHTVDYNGAVGLGEYDTLYTVHNNSGSKILVRWFRTIPSAPQGWSAQICDKNNCYSTTTLSDTFTLQVGESSQMQVHLLATSKGTGQVVLRLSSNFDTTTATTVVNYTLVNTGVSNVPVSNAFMAYNTSNKSVIIKGYNNVQRAEVYDLIGQKVVSTALAADNTSTIDVSSLTTGVYFVRLYDIHNQVIGTKKFIKQ